MRAYEGMFLFDPAAAAEWSNVEAEVKRLISRAEGQLIACKRWDERKLAYEIRGRKRGCYVLTYFRAPCDRIAGLERDVQLSEHILRCLVLRVDHMNDEEMKAAVDKVPEPVPDFDRGDRPPRSRASREEDAPRAADAAPDLPPADEPSEPGAEPEKD